MLVLQYHIFAEIRDDLQVRVICHLDTIMEQLHFRNLREVNKINMAADAKKFAEFEKLITRLEKVLLELESHED